MVKIMSFGYFLDFFIPRQNLQFTDIHSYLSEAEIAACKSSSVILDEKYQIAIQTVFCCSGFENLLIKDLIHRAKFRGEMAIIDDFVKLIEYQLNCGNLTLPDLICFVPPDPKRGRFRGYHVPKILARKLSKKLNLPFAELLYKTKTTVSQVELSRNDRKINLQNVFEISPEIEFSLASFSKVWLLDDVCTTGTTIGECALQIKSNFPFLQIQAVAITGGDHNVDLNLRI